INLLTKRNGFYLKKKYFPTPIPNSWANNSVHIDFLFGIGEDPGLLDNNYLRKEWGIRSKKLLIISTSVPMFICLDYRNTRKKEPSVIFIDVDEIQEIKLANNFEEFINGLVEEIEEEDLYNDDSLTKQQIQDYYDQIDYVISNGKPKEIDRLFTKILSTNKELIRYMVEKMRQHENVSMAK
ncbi:SMI1/KNR4 family protein, partial [Neobacillus drentensis]|uniref:SMI1/KNR4 family protein n=1 Tax=Neobacillus drentensis TaxID=220684 RepID=UPI003001F20D